VQVFFIIDDFEIEADVIEHFQNQVIPRPGWDVSELGLAHSSLLLFSPAHTLNLHRWCLKGEASRDSQQQLLFVGNVIFSSGMEVTLQIKWFYYKTGVQNEKGLFERWPVEHVEDPIPK
jgi:hypothetical protein